MGGAYDLAHGPGFAAAGQQKHLGEGGKPWPRPAAAPNKHEETENENTLLTNSPPDYNPLFLLLFSLQARRLDKLSPTMAFIVLKNFQMNEREPLCHLPVQRTATL